jgi:ArsR family transcriptional regulator
VLRPGGGVTVVTLDEHAHAGETARYGHVHPGFKPATIRRWLTHAGFQVEACTVTSRERRQPHFQVLTAFAHTPTQEKTSP